MNRHALLAPIAALLVVATSPPAEAQTTSTQSAGAAARELTIADYRLWRSIEGETISDDGRWVAWTYAKVRMDDTLHVRSLDGQSPHVVPNGFDPEFSGDGRWVAYFVSPPFAEADRLEREGEDVPLQAGLIELATGERRIWDDVAAFAFAPGSSHLLVRKAAAEGADHDGADLILRNLREGYDELVGSVSDAAFDESGSHLAYTVDSADRDGNGLYVVDLATGARRGLDNAQERYARMTWSDDGGALAVLRGDVPDGKTERANSVVAFAGLDSGTPVRFDFPEDGPGLADGRVISEDGRVVWNDAGTVLFVGTKAQADELDDWPEDGLPLADVNIWHWADDRIQSQQQRQANADRNRTYVAAIHLEDGRMVQLGDERMRGVEVTSTGRWAIGRDAGDYVSDWEPSLADYYRIDTRSGERTPFLQGQLRTLGLSPDGESYLYWRDGHVWRYAIEDDRHTNLTAAAPVSFANAEYDRFGEKPPYGVAGWTSEGDAVLVYDRYDVWLQPLDGRTATNLTRGRGAADEIRLRYLQTDPDAETIDLSQPLLLEAFGQWTKQAGFFRLEDGRLAEITLEDRRFGRPLKAAAADRYLFTVETFRDFPDLWSSDGDFADRERVSDANPQQAEFKWGRRILFDYTNADGVPLQGTLAIPDDWREGQKLPMVVRFYEKYSQDLHAYPTPEYRHQPNFAGLVSNGYLLMMPDVHFRIGSSHSDMLECVEAAVRKVIEMGYADPEAIGLSGHSYSGGGSAYIATRSDMFAAVAHGAAPINLVSEFNQLFVGSGQNNHAYDIYGQGRYATNPYDDFQLYWDQSPISGVENMNTPVLYLHGEADPTVNWEQGLEWYNALRFLGKPIIWLSYPGEGHGLSRLENRIDFQYRLQDFFDHHLKGAPAPEWMTDGVPYTDKERHLRQYAPRVFTRPIG